MRCHMKILAKIIMSVILIGSVCLYAEPPEKIHYKDGLKEYEAVKNGSHNDGTFSQSASEVITLNELLQYTLLNHPELKYYAWDIEGKDALLLQSRKISNPELETELENAGIDAFSISIGQLIELGGKRSSRIALAKLDKNASVWEYEIKRLQILIETGQEYIQALKSQQMIDLLTESIDYAKTSYHEAQKRKNAGAASEIDILQTQKDLELIGLEREKELNRYQAQLQLLAALAGDTQASFSHVMGELEKPAAIPEFTDLITRINRSPEITAWMIRSESYRIIEKNIKAQNVPDILLSAGYARDNGLGDNTFLFGFSLPLPLFDRNKGNITEAKINSYRALFEKEALELRLYHDLLINYTEFENTFKEIQVYSKSIIPLAKTTYNEAKVFYAAGKISSLELLSYQRELLENEMYYIDLLADLYLTKYTLELLIGSEIKIETGE